MGNAFCCGNEDGRGGDTGYNALSNGPKDAPGALSPDFAGGMNGAFKFDKSKSLRPKKRLRKGTKWYLMHTELKTTLERGVADMHRFVKSVASLAAPQLTGRAARRLGSSTASFACSRLGRTRSSVFSLCAWAHCSCSLLLTLHLASGRLPPGEDLRDWVLIHVIDMYNEICLLYGTISDMCTPFSCPCMTAGSKFTYLWADGVSVKARERAATHYTAY